MPRNFTVYKVLISSPSDVRTDASAIADVLKEWSETEGKRQSVLIEPVMWETHAVPEMGDSPQHIINKQLVDSCDLTIALFKARIGTPVDGYASGTVAEIELSLEQGKPCSLYFSHVKIDPSEINLEQYASLQKYEKSCRDKGLHGSYATIIELRKHIRKHIPARVLQLHKQHEAQRHSSVTQANQPESGPGEAKNVDGSKPSFEQLTKRERDYWFSQALKVGVEAGASAIGPNAVLHVARSLYRDSLRSYEDLRAEALAAFKRDIREGGDALSRLAARRLPNDDDPTKKK